MYTTVYDKPNWETDLELEWDVMPRDEFGVPAHIPPEISTTIRHTLLRSACDLLKACLPSWPLLFCRFLGDLLQFASEFLRYYIPPQYYPFLKKLGDDTPELK